MEHRKRDITKLNHLKKKDPDGEAGTGNGENIQREKKTEAPNVLKQHNFSPVFCRYSDLTGAIRVLI